MTAIRLSLSGLTDDEADLAVLALFDHPRLERVLVNDDVGLLAKHEAAYQRLITSYRVHALLCVVVGPRAERDGKLWLPEFLGGVQGYGVLWVGNQAGIDWRPAAVPVANGHAGASDGLDQLVDLLQTDEIFDRVHLAFDSDVHGKVASPGLRLAGADDEAATFTAALAVAVGRLCGAGSGPDGPFPALLPAAEAIVLYCGRFLQLLPWEPSVRTCRLSIAEAERLPGASAQCYDAIFHTPQQRLAAFLAERCQLTPPASTDIAGELRGRTVYPRLLRVLLGVEAPLKERPDEASIAADLDLGPVRKAVAALLPSAATTGPQPGG